MAANVLCLKCGAELDPSVRGWCPCCGADFTHLTRKKKLDETLISDLARRIEMTEDGRMAMIRYAGEARMFWSRRGDKYNAGLPDGDDFMRDATARQLAEMLYQAWGSALVTMRIWYTKED